MGVPYNLLVPGYENSVVNTLRLWKARGSSQFNLDVFNAGDYIEAVRQQSLSENISRVLYPEDSTPAGKELRLRQQYFFTACALADLVRVADIEGFPLTEIPDRVGIQLNDTHPVIAIPELMRILIDERGMDYDTAWDITRRTFNYTCHTLLPEALERWSVGLLQYLLPRHMELIYRINKRFLEQVRLAFPMDESRVIRMSIIEEGPERMVRMAHLATVASAHVNGVAALHSQLLRDTVLHDFYEMWPERFTNVTNGVTPRRFMKLANPRLSDLITEPIGDGWLTDLERLIGLEEYADDPEFQERWRAVKRANKAELAGILEARTGLVFPTDPMYDVMIKRLHEYKRQMLKLLHVATMYRRLRLDPATPIPPRMVLFGAKAAPGYQMAKLIIRLINQVGATIAADPAMAGRLSVVFPANYNVTLAERIIPAADLSEQISMAGKEASGTGNMKLALNGALTIGTLDGANVEIRELVGDDNFFLFGLTEDEVVARKAAGYDPGPVYREDGSCGRSSTRSPAATTPRPASPTCSARSSSPCSCATSTWCWPTTGPTSRPRSASTRCGRTSRRGPPCRSATAPAPGSSPPTARWWTTSTASGSRARSAGVRHGERLNEANPPGGHMLSPRERDGQPVRGVRAAVERSLGEGADFRAGQEGRPRRT